MSFPLKIQIPDAQREVTVCGEEQKEANRKHEV